MVKTQRLLAADIPSLIDDLYAVLRLTIDRKAAPTAAIIDSQKLRLTTAGGERVG